MNTSINGHVFQKIVKNKLMYCNSIMFEDLYLTYIIVLNVTIVTEFLSQIGNYYIEIMHIEKLPISRTKRKFFASYTNNIVGWRFSDIFPLYFDFFLFIIYISTSLHFHGLRNVKD